MGTKERINVSIFIDPLSDENEFERFVESACEQGRDDIEVFFPKQWPRIGGCASVKLKPYDAELALKDMSGVLFETRGNYIFFCTSTSIMPQCFIEDLLVHAVDREVVKSKLMLVDSRVAKPISNRDESLNGMLLERSFLERVLRDHAAFGKEELTIVINALCKNHAPEVTSVLYETDGTQYSFHSAVQDDGIFSYLAQLNPESQIDYASLLIGDEGSYPLESLVDVEEKISGNKAIQFGLGQRYVSKWWDAALNEGDEMAYASVKGYLNAHESDQVILSAMLQCLHIDDRLYPLIKESNLEDLSYVLKATNDSAVQEPLLVAESVLWAEDSEYGEAELPLRQELKDLRNKYAKLERQYNRIAKSYSYKIGHTILVGPYQIVKRVRKYKRDKKNH